MKHIRTFESLSYGKEKGQISEGLGYHLDRNLPLMESVYRIESEAWLDLVNEARILWERGDIELEEDDLFLIGTDAGRTDIYEGEEVLLDVPFYLWDDIDEAEYRGRKVDLNKPFRTPGGPKKYAVYVKSKNGKVKKVTFGDPNMRSRAGNKARRKSFAARHRCSQKKDRTTAGYWSCRSHRMRSLGNKGRGKYW